MPHLYLQGHRVIDCSRRPAGLAALLARWGADVVCVGSPEEATGGWCTRPLSARSATIDLRDHRGQQLIGELTATADVFVHDFSDAEADVLGVAYERLQRLRPGLVAACTTGCQADDAQAADLLGQAIAGALLTHARGARIELPMLRTAAAWLGSGTVAPTPPIFETIDGAIALAAHRPEHVARTLRALDLESWLDDLASDGAPRRPHALHERVTKVLREVTSEEAVLRLQCEGVPSARFAGAAIGEPVPDLGRADETRPGEHTREILEELGVDCCEIRELRRLGVVG